MSKKIIIGRLGDVHGLQGWLHLFSHAEPADNFFHYENFSNKAGKAIEIVLHKPHGNHFVVKLKNCDDRDTALTFKNQDLYIDRAELPPLPDNQFYWDDLIGFAVITTNQKLLGNVDHLFSTGSNDVIAVKGEKLLYVPYLADVIVDVDTKAKKIIVNWEIDV